MWLSKSDLRYTLRQMGKKPGFMLLCALVLAGGLAVSLMTFTVSYTIMFGDLPEGYGDNVVRICPLRPGFDCSEFMADDFGRIREDITTLTNVGIYTGRNFFRTEYNDDLWRQRIVLTESNFFQLTQSQALLGRTLQPDDQLPGAEAVMVIGYQLWQRRFGGNPDIVGSIIRVEQAPVRVVGVMPEGYAMPESEELWMPIQRELLAPLDRSSSSAMVNAYALLRPGVSKEEASVEIDTLLAQNRDQFPRDSFAEYPNFFTSLISEVSTGYVERYTRAWLGGVGAMIFTTFTNLLTLLVFLLVCINVGTLLLARINERMKDTAIRVALGASRKRLLVQICMESTFITLLGSALAVLLAGIGLDLAFFLLGSLTGGGSPLPFWMDFSLKGSTLWGVLFYMLLTIGLTSVLPGWKIINGDFNASMRDGTRGALGLKPGRFSRALVVVALVIVTLLLYLITLLGSTAIPLTNTLDRIPDNMLTTSFVLDEERYDDAERLQFTRTLLARMADDPRVEFGTVTANPGRAVIEAEGNGADERREATLSSDNLLVPGEFKPVYEDRFEDAIAERLMEGRNITEADGRDTELVVSVSPSLAERLWPGESPLDKRLRIVDSSIVGDEWRRVVGMFGDVESANMLTGGNSETVVIPMAQLNTAGVRFSLTAYAPTAANKPQAIQMLRESFDSLDNSVQPIIQDTGTQMETITRVFGYGIKFGLVLGGFIFAVAIAGIFGLTQNSVLMARHEIGVRRAMGARDRLITLMFMKRSAKQLSVGFVLSMLLCWPVTWIFLNIARGVGLNIPFSLTMSALVLLILYVVVMLATYLPVKKILQMEPSDALRYEC